MFNPVALWAGPLVGRPLSALQAAGVPGPERGSRGGSWGSPCAQGRSGQRWSSGGPVHVRRGEANNSLDGLELISGRRGSVLYTDS